MQAAATETITLGALAVRLGDRLDRLVTTQQGNALVTVQLGRDTAKFVKDNYSAPMEWNQAYRSYTTPTWHTTPDGKRVAVRVMVRGGGKE